MSGFLRWYVAVEILGALCLPLAWRLFARLPDRGYCFSKSLAILLVGFILWVGTAYGLARNELGGAVLAVLTVAFGSAIVGWPALRPRADGRRPLMVGLRHRLPLVIATEVLFLVGFAGWALVRAHDPAAHHTEQPMDLLFLSAVWYSPAFPPQDPWLAGYAISYYYFGYWLVGTLARLAGQPPELAYNLGQACWFGLLVIGCWGIGFNLAFLGSRKASRRAPAPMLGGLLAVLAVAIIGNLQALLDALRVAGAVGTAWILGLDGQSVRPHDGVDWWWRTSRIVSDRDLLGRPIEIIDEYPFFSYLLGDNHPHLLAMPFVVLVVALALSLSLGSRSASPWIAAVRSFPAGPAGVAVTIIVAGGLVCLNPWDLPAAWALLIAATALAAARRAIVFALVFPLGTVVAYFPYLLAAQSPVGGVHPNLFHPTALDQLVRVFGVFAPGLAALYWLAWRTRRPGAWPISVSVLCVAAGAALWLVASTTWAWGTAAGRGWLERLPAPAGSGERLAVAFDRWWDGWPTLGALVMLFAVAIALGWSHRSSGMDSRDRSLRFVILLAALGLGLLLGPELGYLRDSFGTRMNTVFKLYYQAWLLLALAASHGTWLALRERGGVRALAVASLAVFGAGVALPIVTLTPRLAAAANPLTLDALAYLQESDADELAAIRWLRANTRPDSVVLQVVGTSYRPGEGRVSATTGRPTLLGWEGHEVQWRGPVFQDQAAGRSETVRAVYGEGPAPELAQLLEAWGIDYVYVGPSEKAKYDIRPAVHARLERVMDLAFKQGRVHIYRRRG